MSKEKVLKYCEQFKMPDVEHIEQAIENASLIKEGKYRYLNGCPSSFGLDGYDGICEVIPEHEQTDLYGEVDDMCEACWKKALGVE